MEVGFECEFVEPPPESLQSDCPICLQIVRNPYKVGCCYKSFCHTCIKYVKMNKKPCPNCRTKYFYYFHDEELEHSLLSLKVHCTHSSNGCEWTGELVQLESHLNTDPQPDKRLDGCPLQTISCSFVHAGCAVKLCRKDMPEHQRESLLTHISLLGTSNAKQHAEIQALKEENSRLKSTLCSPPILAMTDYLSHKRGIYFWYSPPMYTHQKGYKICLRVDVNDPSSNYFGDDDDEPYTHVAVSVHFMKGENDDSLTWPFRGVISFRLLDQVNNSSHVVGRVVYNDAVDDDICSRVVEEELGVIDEEIAEDGFNVPEFIANTDLRPKYLQDNTLLFQIHEVQLYPQRTDHRMPAGQ